MTDLTQQFYKIVEKYHQRHLDAGFTLEHAYAEGVLRTILSEMDKLKENKSIGQILDDFYDKSRKLWHEEHMNHLKKPDENIP